ncbi:MAG: hypothetical protein GC181_06465 [Bacteroidetes bacterium]|nr:hypothetical protein [Bacteroidota bacterium]
MKILITCCSLFLSGISKAQIPVVVLNKVPGDTISLMRIEHYKGTVSTNPGGLEISEFSVGIIRKGEKSVSQKSKNYGFVLSDSSSTFLKSAKSGDRVLVFEVLATDSSGRLVQPHYHSYLIDQHYDRELTYLKNISVDIVTAKEIRNLDTLQLITTTGYQIRGFSLVYDSGDTTKRSEIRFVEGDKIHASQLSWTKSIKPGDHIIVEQILVYPEAGLPFKSNLPTLLIKID